MSEHRVIERGLDLMLQMQRKIEEGEGMPECDLRSLISFFRDYVERIHHGKEEAVLFPTLDREGSVTSGPLCGLFMGQRVRGGDPATWILSEAMALEPPLPPHRLRPEADRLIQCVSYLSIPLEDHVAGHQALAMLERVIDQGDFEQGDFEQSDFEGSRALKVAKRMYQYRSLLSDHIRKEDGCLFVMASEALSVDCAHVLDLEMRKYAEENEALEQHALRALEELEANYR